MKKLLLLMIVVTLPCSALAGWFGPSNYDECIFENMKGVGNKTAAYQIAKACERQFRDTSPVVIKAKADKENQRRVATEKNIKAKKDIQKELIYCLSDAGENIESCKVYYYTHDRKQKNRNNFYTRTYSKNEKNNFFSKILSVGIINPIDFISQNGYKNKYPYGDDGYQYVFDVEFVNDETTIAFENILAKLKTDAKIREYCEAIIIDKQTIPKNGYGFTLTAHGYKNDIVSCSVMYKISGSVNRFIYFDKPDGSNIYSVTIWD